MNGQVYYNGSYPFGAYGIVDEQSTSALSKVPAKPPTGVKTGPQTLMPNALGAWSTPLSGILGLLSGGGNQFIYRKPPKFALSTYRLIMKQPTNRMLFRSKVNKILASSWSVKSADKAKPATDQAIQLVKDMFIPQRRRFLNESLKYMWSGVRQFEKVWQPKNTAKYWLRLKPLLPDWTIIYRDPYGDYAGLKTYHTPLDYATRKDDDLNGGFLDPHKSLIITNDGEGGNFYGSSRCDNNYDTFVDWNQSKLKMAQTRGKIAGSIVKIYHPQGSSQINGVDTDNADIASQIGVSLTMGDNYVTIPCGPEFGEIIQTEKGTESLWKIEVEDTAGYSDGITAMLEEMAYWDKLFCRGWDTPERSMIEATKAGSRADSGTASDVAIDDLAAIQNDICDQLNHGQDGVTGAVDDVLLFNRGPSEVGSVIIEPAPLVDTRRQMEKEMLLAMMSGSGPQAAEAWARLDKDQTYEDLDLAMDADFDIDEYKADLEAKQEKQNQTRMTMPGVTGNDNPLEKTKPVPAKRPQDK